MYRKKIQESQRLKDLISPEHRDGIKTKTLIGRNKDSISAICKKKSLDEFITSGRKDTIKKKILLFLSKNPTRSYTASELQTFLFVKYRSSVCYPLNELVKDRWIVVVGDKLDYDTNREVGLYQIAKTLFS